MPSDRGGIDFEIPGVDDRAHRGFDRVAHRVCDRMVDPNRLNVEKTEL
ncbi:hypothetical protein SDC9_158805 [bioreactor metagenome]|uniref:Uncharacterized protein n=1 Tax=bioreactor metagenome TaxID=1076179 RepID=A0A645FDG8_9ZZZZ